MRRHSIIARLDPTDKIAVKLHEPHSITTEIRYIDGHHQLGYGLGQLIEQLARRGVFTSDAAVDLALLAATVTAADTRISRETESQDSWTREIDLYMPVLDPTMWTASSRLIERMLNFLTGDRWRVFFRDRWQGCRKIVNRPPELISSPFDCVCLFSGGLDSYVGAIDLLSANKKPLFVSHYWEPSTSTQELCAQRIGSVYGDMAGKHVRARIGFPDDLVTGSAPEKSQRGRSFLFFAMAALAADGLTGAPIIYIPENGLISLNVPLDPLRVGAWSTRTTHPFYMARWDELNSRIGFNASFENPYRFQTKGEMLDGCANQNLVRRHAHETISCSSVTKGRWKGLRMGHCGYCVPCLIRRAAFQRAFGTDPTDYPAMPDLTADRINARAAEGEHIRSFQMMARRLAQKPALARLLVYKSGPLPDYDGTDIVAYAEVFRRGIEEVDAIVHECIVEPS